MHEWALAEGVIATALDVAEEQEWRRITRIVVRVGEMQHIDPDFFRSALESVLPEGDERIASPEFDLRLEPAEFRCRGCRHSFALEEAGGDLEGDRMEAVHFIPELAHGYLQCPQCASPDFEVIGGRGIWLDKLEGER